MSIWRILLSGGLLLVGGLASLDKAQAQQTYEFGIRFPPVNFRPTNFQQFSFSGHGFRTDSMQSIQFNRINFPAFNSRVVRRDAAKTPDRARSERSIVFHARDDRARHSDSGSRLVKRRETMVPTLASRRATEGVYNVRFQNRSTENTRRVALRESKTTVSLRSSRFARFDRLADPSPRAAKRQTASTNVRTASRVRGEVFSSTAIR